MKHLLSTGIIGGKTAFGQGEKEKRPLFYKEKAFS
jgi:hypothetical protein